MGSRPKLPPPPPPPPAPRDESDVVNLAALMAQRQSVAGKGFRRAFLSGPRGEGGPDWQAVETPAAGPGKDPNVSSELPAGYKTPWQEFQERGRAQVDTLSRVPFFGSGSRVPPMFPMPLRRRR